MCNLCHQSSSMGLKAAILACISGMVLVPQGDLQARAGGAALPPLFASKHGESAGESIRQATGLRFRVAESIIRRNITSTRTPYGFKVKSVDAGSPAALGGLRKGDVLLEWDGKPIKSRSELADWIDEARAASGEAGIAEVSIKYARLKENRRALDRKPWVEHQGTIRISE